MAVERFKHNGEWKIIGSSSGKVQIADDKLDPESINSVQNKVITKALEYKADIVDKLVNAYGIRSEGNVGYYMPNIGVGDPEHTLATKADIISNEVLESKATVYNLYAMDDLTEEQVEANAKALESVQNREVAIYKVYTNNDTYTIADVKLVDGPYLEAYVYVNNPDETSKQATITKYTYTFNQAGVYDTSDKEEVIVPSLSKVEEMVGSSGGGGGGVGSIAVDDALSLTSTNPVQNKVISENLDGIVYLDLELSALDANGLNSFFAKLSTLIGDSRRIKSFYCLYKGDVVKVDRLCMIGETTYVFFTKGVLQYVMAGTKLAELPWVFSGGTNNRLSYLGLLNLSALCKEAVIEIDGIRYPVTSYEYGTSAITLYAIIKDHLNQYEVDTNGNMNLVSSEAIINPNVYFLPAGLMADEYDFSPEEAQKFRDAINTPNTAFYLSVAETGVAFHFPLTVTQNVTGKAHIKYLQTEPNNEQLMLSLWSWVITYDDNSAKSTFSQIVKTL